MTFSRDCARCKRLMKESTCRGSSDWWPIKELWFCRIQTLFLLENLDAYPPNPYTSGYTEAPLTSHRIGANAPFETELQIWGELNFRLARTGLAGQWLIREVQNGVGLGELPSTPLNALHYVSGWWRKSISYKKWLWQLEERKMRIKHPHKNVGYLTTS